MSDTALRAAAPDGTRSRGAPASSNARIRVEGLTKRYGALEVFRRIHLDVGEREPVVDPIAGVAMVFRHFGLFPWKTVYGNDAYGLRMAGVAKAEIARRVPAFIVLLLAAFGVGFDAFVNWSTRRFLPWYRRDDATE